MIHATTSYIVFNPGNRHSTAGHQTIIQQFTGSYSPGDLISVPVFPKLHKNGDDVGFIFMSVSGADDGSHIYTNPAVPQILVGSTDIIISVIYIPIGPNGSKAGHEVYVDAYNMDTGNFLDSDFVEVHTNGFPDQNKTTTANTNGYVSSNTSSVLKAVEKADGIPFLLWQKLGSTAIQGTEYEIKVNETGLLIAFYHTEKTQIRKLPHIPLYEDWRRIREPWPPPPPIMKELIGAISLAESADMVSPELRSNVLELILKQISAASSIIKSELKPMLEKEPIK